MARVNQTKLEFIKKDVQVLYDSLNFRSLKPESQRRALLAQIVRSLDFHVGDSERDRIDYLDRLMEELNVGKGSQDFNLGTG